MMKKPFIDKSQAEPKGQQEQHGDHPARRRVDIELVIQCIVNQPDLHRICFTLGSVGHFS
jgi:hypothetical protein